MGRSGCRTRPSTSAAARPPSLVKAASSPAPHPRPRGGRFTSWGFILESKEIQAPWTSIHVLGEGISPTCRPLRRSGGFRTQASEPAGVMPGFVTQRSPGGGQRLSKPPIMGSRLLWTASVTLACQIGGTSVTDGNDQTALGAGLGRCVIAWQTHRTARLRDYSPRLVTKSPFPLACLVTSFGRLRAETSEVASVCGCGWPQCVPWWHVRRSAACVQPC
jgi:hypothetical protein